MGKDGLPEECAETREGTRALQPLWRRVACAGRSRQPLWLGRTAVESQASEHTEPWTGLSGAEVSG